MPLLHRATYLISATTLIAMNLLMPAIVGTQRVAASPSTTRPIVPEVGTINGPNPTQIVDITDFGAP